MLIYLKLIWSYLKIGLFGFGGGYAMLALIEREIVGPGWISKQMFTDIVAISQMTPGPIGINSATYIGYVAPGQYDPSLVSPLWGLLGSVTCTLVVVLPSFLLVAYTSHLIARHKDSVVIKGIFAGLREPASAIDRADMVVVTKCPDQLKPIEYRIFKKNLDLFPCQNLYFSRYRYGKLVPLYPDIAEQVPTLDYLTEDDAIMAISGIANPKPFVKHLSRHRATVKLTVFPDHHSFSRRDIEAIAKRYDEMDGDLKYIITTEKDAVRLSCNPYFPHRLKAVVFYLPITVEMDAQSSASFTEDLVKTIRLGKTGV